MTEKRDCDGGGLACREGCRERLGVVLLCSFAEAACERGSRESWDGGRLGDLGGREVDVKFMAKCLRFGDAARCSSSAQTECVLYESHESRYHQR